MRALRLLDSGDFVIMDTEITGLARYQRQGAFAEGQALKKTIAPMGVGSVIGAAIGGLLVGIIPAS